MNEFPLLDRQALTMIDSSMKWDNETGIGHLIWALIDDEITDQQLLMLERQLCQNDAARRKFTEYAMLHRGLDELFAARKQRCSPVLTDADS